MSRTAIRCRAFRLHYDQGPILPPSCKSTDSYRDMRWKTPSSDLDHDSCNNQRISGQSYPKPCIDSWYSYVHKSTVHGISSTAQTFPFYQPTTVQQIPGSSQQLCGFHLMHESEIQSLGTFILCGRDILDLLGRRHGIPDLITLLVSTDVVELGTVKYHDVERTDGKQDLVTSAVCNNC